MSVNLINGRVVTKESGLGIPDLLVVIHDLDPGTESQDPDAGHVEGSDTESELSNLGDRLGSRLTGKDGVFQFSFEDEEFRSRNENEKRPDLHLAVLAPEEPGFKSRVLFTSSHIRHDAGRTEEYLIRLPRDILENAGISTPVELVQPRENAETVVERLKRAETWRADIKESARKLAETRVSAARDAARKIDNVVEERLIESLGGLTPGDTTLTNIVPPGGDTEQVVWEATGRRIAALNAQPDVVGYLVLTPGEADKFRDGEDWRTDITKEEIEPFLFGSANEDGRPLSVVRTDPLEALCVEADRSDPFASQPSGSGNGVSNAPILSNGADDDTPVTTLDLPRFVGRMINGMSAPEDTSPGAEKGRPDAQAVQDSIAELRIASGPADVTAFHDYHTLQIAFDHVWQQFLDEDVLETGKALAREIADGGGDPLTALADGGDPIKALKRETQYIAKTRDPFDKQLPDWVTDLGPLGPQIDGGDGGWGGGAGGSGGGDTGGGDQDTGGKSKNKGGIDTGAVVVTDPVVGQRTPKYPHELLNELDAMLNERYKFEVFAPGSTNFGLLVSYRQKWKPITYQAGDLVHTVTLAPKETRKVTSRRTVRRERAVKETETNLRNRSDESKSTMRADAEVVDRASTKTNFNLNAKGTYDIGVASGDSTMTIDRTAEASSQETKKSFHESVMSAAMQLRSEKGWSFESKDTYEDEVTESSEISNPNDELTVTYLFYELERRFHVSEHLHRLTPVVLVAMEVPNPGRQSIDRVLLAHSWIINRVLLDDRYRAPLEYLTQRIVGDELGLHEMALNIQAIRSTVTQLTEMHKHVVADRDIRAAQLAEAMKIRAQEIAKGDDSGLLDALAGPVLSKAWDLVSLGGGEDKDVESARVIEDMNRESYERSVREEKDIRMRLDAETAALNAASQAYAKAYAEHMNRMMEVGGLRAHIKENILYYMQAIWSFAFEDQTFFSLFKVKAPLLSVQSKTYAVSQPTSTPVNIPTAPGRIVLQVTAGLTLNSAITVQKDAVTLAEIADLDNPLGFKGNYMIFPLKKSNPLTDYMMVPYLDSELGLHDPDELGSWAPDDFVRYGRCLLKAHSKLGDLSRLETEELQERLLKQYRQIVSSPRRVSDDIVVPTNSLFIEALPGEHALLEDFKADHRRMDVERVREETRKLKLESLRYAARILENTLGDPEIEKQVNISGTDGVLPVEE